jgi:hypothetical protein
LATGFFATGFFAAAFFAAIFISPFFDPYPYYDLIRLRHPRQQAAALRMKLPASRAKSRFIGLLTRYSAYRFSSRTPRGVATPRRGKSCMLVRVSKNPALFSRGTVEKWLGAQRCRVPRAPGHTPCSCQETSPLRGSHGNAHTCYTIQTIIVVYHYDR